MDMDKIQKQLLQVHSVRELQYMLIGVEIITFSSNQQTLQKQREFQKQIKQKYLFELKQKNKKREYQIMINQIQLNKQIKNRFDWLFKASSLKIRVKPRTKPIKKPLPKRTFQIEHQSFRNKSTNEQNLKQSRTTQLQKGFTIQQGGLFNQQSTSMSVSIEDMKLAYNKILQLENLLTNNIMSGQEELIKELFELTKKDLKEHSIDQSKTQVGKYMLENGLFYIIHGKIKLKSTGLAQKHLYLDRLRHKYLPKVVENKQELQRFIDRQQRKQAERQQENRESMRKKQLPIQSHFMDIMQNPHIGESIIKRHVMTEQDRLNKIKQDQSCLIDFFQIDDVYQNKMVQVTGVLDEIDGMYAILVVKPRNGKDKGKEVMAIGLMRKLQNYMHKEDKLKVIYSKYPNIFAYVDIKDFRSILIDGYSETSQQAPQEK